MYIPEYCGHFLKHANAKTNKKNKIYYSKLIDLLNHNVHYIKISSYFNN